MYNNCYYLYYYIKQQEFAKKQQDFFIFNLNNNKKKYEFNPIVTNQEPFSLYENTFFYTFADLKRLLLFVNFEIR